jgi:uncharacterized membrane protein
MFKNLNIRYSSMILAIIGVIDALYLSYSKIFHVELYCAGSNNCATVNSSRFAEIGGFSIAFIGLGGYIAILAILFLEGKNIQKIYKENIPLVLFGFSLIGSLYSIYLTYIEIVILKAVCPYCFISAIVMWILFILASIRVFRQANS